MQSLDNTWPDSECRPEIRDSYRTLATDRYAKLVLYHRGLDHGHRKVR